MTDHVEALERIAQAADTVLLLVDRHRILLVPQGPPDEWGAANKAISELRAARDGLAEEMRLSLIGNMRAFGLSGR